MAGSCSDEDFCSEPPVTGVPSKPEVSTATPSGNWSKSFNLDFLLKT